MSSSSSLIATPAFRALCTSLKAEPANAFLMKLRSREDWTASSCYRGT